MGWARGKNSEGRLVGYAVKATCDAPGCKRRIDRGLSYVCGPSHNPSTTGCGHYFCPDHLVIRDPNQMCEECSDAYDREYGKEKDDAEEGAAQVRPATVGTKP